MSQSPTTLVQFSYSCEKYEVTLRAPVIFGGGAFGAGQGLQQWNPSNGAQAGFYSPALGLADVYGSAPIGSRGIALVTRKATGIYTVTLQDAYQRLLRASCSFGSPQGVDWNTSKPLPSAPLVEFVSQDSVNGGTDVTNTLTTNGYAVTAFGGYVELAFFTDAASPALADPASGELGLIELVLDKSSST